MLYEVITAQLRRQSYSVKEPEEDVISVGDLIIDKARHQVTVKGKKVSLTPLEFSILDLMASHRGYVFSVDKIYELVCVITSYSIHYTKLYD